jgi:hypothetical protein
MLLAIPQGYTLTVAATLAFTVRHYPGTTLVDVMAFVSEALIAFVLLVVLSHPQLMVAPSMPVSRWVYINLLPLLAVPAGALGASVTRVEPLGYGLASLLAVGTYLSALSLYLAHLGALRLSPRASQVADEEVDRTG